MINNYSLLFSTARSSFYRLLYNYEQNPKRLEPWQRTSTPTPKPNTTRVIVLFNRRINPLNPFGDSSIIINGSTPWSLVSQSEVNSSNLTINADHHVIKNTTSVTASVGLSVFEPTRNNVTNGSSSTPATDVQTSTSKGFGMPIISDPIIITTPITFNKPPISQTSTGNLGGTKTTTMTEAYPKPDLSTYATKSSSMIEAFANQTTTTTTTTTAKNPPQTPIPPYETPHYLAATKQASLSTTTTTTMAVMASSSSSSSINELAKTTQMSFNEISVADESKTTTGRKPIHGYPNNMTTKAPVHSFKGPSTTRRPTTFSTRRQTTPKTHRRPSTTSQLPLVDENQWINQIHEITTPKPYVAKRDCGIRQPMKTREGRIVGGRDSQLGEFPWSVLIRETTLLGFFVKTKCGGVLIDVKWVLTAAHCQPGIFGSLVIVVGDYELGGGKGQPMTGRMKPIIRKVKRMIIHRDYNPSNFDNDIALLELETPYQIQPNVVPICLPEKGEFEILLDG